MTEDLTVTERYLALGKRSHLWVVGDHDDGVALGMKVLEKLRHNLLVGGIQISRGFIRQQNRRVVDEGSGDADALLLAAG
jgi:hypothetical protein